MPENNSAFMSLFMSPEAIIDKLTNSGYYLPEASLNAAAAMPEVMTPLLLNHLERIADNPEEISDDENRLGFYALLLLARFKEARTLPILRKMLDKAPESLDPILGDGLTELGGRLFASWASSTPDDLWPFIENRKLDEFVRSAAFEAYQCLYCNGIVTQEYMRPYLHRLAHEILRQEPGAESLLWFNWVRCCFALGLDEFRPLAKKAYDEQWIEPMLSTWDDELEDLSSGRVQGWMRKNFAEFISDIPEELRDWHCFSEEYREKMRSRKEEDDADDLMDWEDEDEEDWDTAYSVDTFAHEAPKVRPNDPCPCGSGKKYKKCCRP